ncbi:TadE/TadG family type IV pilus assembly protein [Altererythrobacter sp. MTPC7]|uniref:TadE/TadG family type IV pilus assembly protein n=1 Tax=Altererythrobacter sp. MTPC7 TaxID=3056567 RepID=UPI0036F37818
MTRRFAHAYGSGLRRLANDETGATLTEFGFVAPILCLMLVGLFDFGFQIYAKTVMQGALQQSARKSTLEPTITTTDALDAAVRQDIKLIVPDAKIDFERKNYATFANVQKPEDYIDTNGNGVCDNGEQFDDVNDNGTWDADRGKSGLGGARDAVLYTVTAQYDRMFPLDTFINVPKKISVTASTVLRNQPYDGQQERPVVLGNCT